NHAPHHVPKEWADKYKGKFDDGWDAYRDKVFARQKELGIMPQNALLSRHDRRTRQPEVFQSLRLGLDLRRQHAVSALEARNLSRRRIRPVHRALAEGHQGEGRNTPSIRT